ncbi:hypothetical protein R9X47_23735 [Wukongibacter baidiensis]|uniref:hypothetical protein n=1 Tax=Wukongibacter baidiensis TaxID=1723361 RepID=UPI003D7F656D
MKRVLVLIIILLMVVSLVSGCLNNKNEPEGDSENRSKNEDQVETTENNETANKRISQTGIYTGQVDNNFIEIKVDNGPMVLMLTEEVRKSMEEINEGDEIDFVYYKNEDDQYILVSIIKKDIDEEVIKTSTGVYVGQLDNFSIEIEIDDASKVFINYEMNKLLKGVEQGDKVEVKYTENEQGQLDLKSLRKVE